MCFSTDGYIVCEEFEEILRAAWLEEQEILKQKEKEVCMDAKSLVFEHHNTHYTSKVLAGPQNLKGPFEDEVLILSLRLEWINLDICKPKNSLNPVPNTTNTNADL